jgi:hypothetical protein
MVDDCFWPFGDYAGYCKYSKRRSAYVARLVDRRTGAAVVALDCATPEDARAWLAEMAKHAQRQEAGRGLSEC